jgi:hypothetical protein
MVINKLVHPKPWVYYSTTVIPTRPIKPFIPFKLNHTVGTIPEYLTKIRLRTAAATASIAPAPAPAPAEQITE